MEQFDTGIFPENALEHANLVRLLTRTNLMRLSWGPQKPVNQALLNLLHASPRFESCHNLRSFEAYMDDDVSPERIAKLMPNLGILTTSLPPLCLRVSISGLSSQPALITPLLL